MKNMTIIIAASLLLLIVSLHTVAPASAMGALEVHISGLDLPSALAISPDGRVFFAELWTGNIRIADDRELLPEPFFTLENTVSGGERGLVGLALDPDFPNTPYVYAYHTFYDAERDAEYNRIVRIMANGNIGSFDTVLLDQIPAGTHHNSGPLTFGTDGMLYATIGDTEDAAAPQDLTSLAGKILRLNRDGSVPADNPFVGNETVNPYIYTYGHRNVFGITAHPSTGGIYITENGPACNDEVNVLVPGANYGWGPSNTCSTPPAGPLNTNQDGPDPTMPIRWWKDPIGPTNVVVYSGPKFPQFQGNLIMADWNERRIRLLELSRPGFDSILRESVIVQVPQGIVGVAVGPDGAIWFSTFTTLYRFYDSTPPFLSLVSPRESLTNHPLVTVAGITEPSASVRVNGIPVAVNLTGTFYLNLELADGLHSLSVVATDVVGNVARIQIVIEVDTEPPALTLTAPADGSDVDLPVVTVAGATDPGAYLVVNGMVVRVATNGSFAFALPLSEEVNLITATATDPAGNSATVTRVVTYQNPTPYVDESLATTGRELDATRNSLDATIEQLEETQAELEMALSRIDLLGFQLQVLMAAMVAILSVLSVAVYRILRRKTRDND